MVTIHILEWLNPHFVCQNLTFEMVKWRFPKIGLPPNHPFIYS